MLVAPTIVWWVGTQPTTRTNPHAWTRCFCPDPKKLTADGCQALCTPNNYCVGPWDEEYQEGAKPAVYTNPKLKKCPGVSVSGYGSTEISHCSCPVPPPLSSPPAHPAHQPLLSLLLFPFPTAVPSPYCCSLSLLLFPLPTAVPSPYCCSLSLLLFPLPAAVPSPYCCSRRPGANAFVQSPPEPTTQGSSWRYLKVNY